MKSTSQTHIYHRAYYVSQQLIPLHVSTLQTNITIFSTHIPLEPKLHF